MNLPNMLEAKKRTNNKVNILYDEYKITDDALNLIIDIAEYYRRQPNFANARTIRNIIDQVLMNQNLRTEDMEENDTIILCDVEDYLTDEGIDITRSSSGTQRIGFI